MGHSCLAQQLLHRATPPTVVAGPDPAIHGESRQFEPPHGPPGQARG